MFLSSLAFSFMNLLAKAVSQEIPPAEVTFFRFLVGILSLRLLAYGGWVDLTPKDRRWLIVRGLLGTGAILFLYMAIANTSLTNAILLGNTYVLFSVIFGVWFLKERAGWDLWVSLLLAFAGVLLISKPEVGEGLRRGDLYALISGVLGGAAINATRFLRHQGGESAVSILYYFSIIGCLISSIVMVPHLVIPNPLEGVYLLGLGLLAAFGQLLMTYAYKYVDVGVGSLLSLTTILFSIAGASLIFHETPSLLTLLGGVLILAPALYISLRPLEEQERNAVR